MGAKIALVGLLVYLLNPVDLIPEFIPILGPVDDAVVAVLVLRYVRRRVGVEELRRRWVGSPEGFALYERDSRHRLRNCQLRRLGPWCPPSSPTLITDELRAVARPERAIQEKAYLKSDLEFLGASVWEIRRVVKAFVKGAPPRASDPDFWIRRSSLLAELRLVKTGGDLAPFLRRAEAMLDEREFFIRKAIGWVLREVSKKRPDEVIAWVAPRTHRASGVTMREAVRYLSIAERDRLMAAYREKRPAA